MIYYRDHKYSKKLYSRTYYSTDLSTDTKGLYYYNIPDNKFNFELVSDILALYYHYPLMRDGIDIYFKSEKDCMLWRLKYGI